MCAITSSKCQQVSYTNYTDYISFPDHEQLLAWRAVDSESFEHPRRPSGRVPDPTVLSEKLFLLCEKIEELGTESLGAVLATLGSASALQAAGGLVIERMALRSASKESFCL